jgi:hypothetical protein
MEGLKHLVSSLPQHKRSQAMFVVHARGTGYNQSTQDVFELFGVFTTKEALVEEATRCDFFLNPDDNWVSDCNSFILTIREVSLDTNVFFG